MILLSRANRVLGIVSISSGGTAMTVVDVKLFFAATIITNYHSGIVIGRKAFLFTGSHQAAEMAAGMYSFMASCKKNNINEFECLKDVFERIQNHIQKKTVPTFSFKLEAAQA